MAAEHDRQGVRFSAGPCDALSACHISYSCGLHCAKQARFFFISVTFSVSLCGFIYGIVVKSTHEFDVGLMLGQSLRR